MNTIRLMLVDDHDIVRTGLKSFLDTQEGIEVVAEASSGGEALEHAQKYNPDVVVMDITMPELNGIDAAQKPTHPEMAADPDFSAIQQRPGRLLRLGQKHAVKVGSRLLAVPGEGHMMPRAAGQDDLVPADHLAMLRPGLIVHAS